MKFKKMNLAFTLAEVLITLGVIGVVAVMTMPLIITNYQKTQTVIKLKKAYTTIAQAINRAKFDYDSPALWDIGENNSGVDAVVFMSKYLLPYLKVLKVPTAFDEGNWDGTRYYLNYKTANSYSSKHARLYLVDGTSITGSIQNNNDFKYFVMYIDINGDKKPNRFGKDIFYYILYINNPDNTSVNGKFLPQGWDKSVEDITVNDTSASACNKKNKSYGYACASLIMQSGWKIPDNYPW